MTATPPPIALVVLDFDGTLTDVDSHAPAFYAASRQALGQLLGWDGATQQREWSRTFEAVMQLLDSTRSRWHRWRSRSLSRRSR